MSRIPFLSFIFCTLSLNYIANAQQIPDLKKHELSGKVRSVHQYLYKAVEKFGEPTKGKRIEQKSLTFDENGKLISEETTNKEKIVHRSNVYSSNGVLVSYSTKEYKVRDEAVDSSTLSVTNTTVTVDSKGRILDETDYDNNGQLIGKRINKYSMQDPILTVEESKYDSEGRGGIKRICKYDSKGNLVERNTDINQREQSTKFSYDLKGNKIEEKAYYGGSLLGSAKCKYDASNLPIEVNAQTSQGLNRTTIYKYEKDKNGNYILRVKLNAATYNGSVNRMEAEEILEREISYY